MPVQPSSKRQSILQVLSLGYTIASILMLYVGLGVITNTEYPVVVVLSGSMEPGFKRGDLLFIVNPSTKQYKAADILVFKIPHLPIPIVHRAIAAADVCSQLGHASTPMLPSSKPVRDQWLLTKGDANFDNDLILYQNFERIQRKHVIGKVRGVVPYVGYISIIMNDRPNLKYLIFGLIGLMSLIQRE